MQQNNMFYSIITSAQINTKIIGQIINIPNSKWLGVDASYIDVKELNTSGDLR